MRRSLRWPVLACLCCSVLLVGCGGGEPTRPSAERTPTKGTPSLRIVSGAAATDTIDAALAQPLVVEVRDTAGAPRAGITVRFVVPGDMGAEALVAPARSATFGRIATAVTDASGQASAYVRLGRVAGAARVAVEVPEISSSDTARFTSNPGALARLTLDPQDSTAFVGKSLTFQQQLFDRNGNLRSHPISFSTSSPLATVSGSGTFSATAGAATSLSPKLVR